MSASPDIYADEGGYPADEYYDGNPPPAPAPPDVRGPERLVHGGLNLIALPPHRLFEEGGCKLDGCGIVLADLSARCTKVRTFTRREVIEGGKKVIVFDAHDTGGCGDVSTVCSGCGMRAIWNGGPCGACGPRAAGA